jgi:hypothetical protein
MRTQSRWLGILPILILLVVAGCGGNGGNGSNGPSGSVAGAWTISETVGPNTCGDAGTSSYTITITQNGNSVTVATPAGTFSGSVSGNTVSWTGSYPEDNGITTITSLTATVSGTNLSGSAQWTWTDGNLSCGGSSTFTGTKN